MPINKFREASFHTAQLIVSGTGVNTMRTNGLKVNSLALNINRLIYCKPYFSTDPVSNLPTTKAYAKSV